MKKALTLLLLLALSSSALLTACSSDNGGSTADTTASQVDETTAEVTEETRIPAHIPDNYDLEGYEMTYYGNVIEVDKNNSERGVYAEAETGDTINDAVFKRNSKLMEKYNFTIGYVTCTDGSEHPINTVKNVILAGDDAYDVLLESAGYMAGLASEGMIVDLASLEHMSLDSPWWLQTINETLKIGDKLYCTVGSHMIRTKTFLYSAWFNHTIAENYGVDKNELYTAAKEGRWTFDMLKENAKKAKSDLNGDGAYDSHDLWGVSGEDYCAYTLAYGAGVDYAKSGDDGIPYITVNTDRNIGIIQDVLNFMTDTDLMLVTNRIPGVENVWKTRTEMLTNDKYLFFLGQPGYEAVRHMESDFGILPSPKYDESQESYRHMTTVYNCTMIMIPISAADVEKVGFIQEAMSYESYYDFLPEFYKNYVETKYARDEESIEMLRIIHDTIYFDLSGLYASDKILSVLQGIARSGQGADTIASTLAANEEAANIKMREVIEKIMER